MHVTSLGATGLTVTPIGLGLAALGRPGYINLGHAEDLGSDRSVATLERNAHAVLGAAYDAGVRYFDAARSYGRAEEYLRSWLDRRDLAPGSVTIGSKWGYRYTADWHADADVHEMKDHSAAALRGQFAETRASLGDHLNLYQIHSATLETGVLEDSDVLAKLVALRDQGIVVGVSVSGPRQTETIYSALEAEIDGVAPFQAVQATWNLLERSTTPALAAATEAGWGVIVKETVANGRLTARNQQSSFGAQRKLLERTAAHHDVTIDAVAIAAVLAQPWVSVVLAGPATVDQLKSNLSALALSLSSDDLAALATLAEHRDEYWTTRAALRWN
jgi:aryl-alcohol dehydrogenase-like predicted oxidoreductase